MMNRYSAVLLMILALMTDFASGMSPGDRVDNFRLLDQEGNSHELYYLSDKKAIVLMIQGNGCPIVRNALPTLKKIRAQYEAKEVSFLLLNANLQDDRTSVAAEADEFDINFPILLDESQLIAESFGVDRTSEVFVVDPDGWQLKYRGPIDDRLSYEAQKPRAKHHYLKDALDAVLGGEKLAIAQQEAGGCLMNLPGRDADHQQISYVNEIAPMLVDNCVVCHRSGGIGPFAMDEYKICLLYTSPSPRD